jgi:pimeloyl-ACP methyl ester carboxylesterase
MATAQATLEQTQANSTQYVTSKDGTRIAYECSGKGPALILVDGAMCYRDSGPMRPLAELLNTRFTVYIYDRRGRGESGNTLPYAVEREVEDMEALLREADGTAFVYGISSGAALALEAANRLQGIKKLATYEAPFIVDNTLAPRPADLADQMKNLAASGKRGAAVRLFMRTVGVPAIIVALMRFMPGWSKMSAIAHTLEYDMRVLGDTGSGKPLPASRWSNVTMPTLVMDGGKSPEYMRNAQKALYEVLPNAQFRTLEGQTHMLKPEALVPSLLEFFV